MKKINNYILGFIFCLSSLDLFAQVDTAWVRRYRGPANDNNASALAVDGSGNVYVTGISWGGGTDYDYATIKYAPNGDTLWVRRYGAGYIYNGPTALAVDGNGNAYVTGWAGTIKYLSNGDIAWIRSGGNAMVVDTSGNVYVAGGWPGTIKYLPNGDTAWVGYNNGQDIALDDSGNVYVTGYAYSGGTRSDYATIKYAPNGDSLWASRYNGPGNGYDYATALAVDDSGNVYVTGFTDPDTFPYNYNGDYATIKYAPNGDTLWVRRYNGPANKLDQAVALAVDGSGNVCVTGYSQGSGTNWEYVTIKYAPNGDTVWVRRYNEAANNEQGIALAVDDIGNVYVSGTSVVPDVRVDYATIKYAPNGDTLWVSRYNGPGNSADEAYALAVDDSGNVYVTGGSMSSDFFLDYVTIKYVQFACIDTAGDINGDEKVNLTDIVFEVNYVFKGGPMPSPLCRGDANADGKINLSDIIYDVNYIFRTGPAPVKSRECCL